jgi:cytochrome bd-type quinol oxidase subunit 2
MISAGVLISGLRNRQEQKAFLASNGLIAGLLATGAATIFPVMLYSTLAPENSLTASAVASSPKSLLLAAIWWPFGFVLAAGYFIFISRQYRGKVSASRDNQGY